MYVVTLPFVKQVSMLMTQQICVWLNVHLLNLLLANQTQGDALNRVLGVNLETIQQENVPLFVIPLLNYTKTLALICVFKNVHLNLVYTMTHWLKSVHKGVLQVTSHMTDWEFVCRIVLQLLLFMEIQIRIGVLNSVLKRDLNLWIIHSEDV